jgi:protein-S-isoprenylcysteine O-methyltransferase Ste14
VSEETVITRHGRPAGVLIGFGSEDDGFEYRLEHHPVKERRWKGKRGEWYVAAQFAILLLIILGPRTWGGWPPWAFPANWLVASVGMACLVGGGCLALAGVVKVGRALTPLPYPGAEAALQETGVYRYVRHPMYSGVLLGALGWALVRRGWLTLAYVALGWAFLELKVRREERWLVERFPAYPEYRERVAKFIPFLY